MSSLADIDDDIFKPVTRLSKGFALRDLIAGAEFEINEEDSCLDADDEEYFKSSKYSPDEVKDYINLSALDLETDESDNIVSFPELREKMNNVTPDGKVMKLVKRAGTGNVVKPDSIVFIHYQAHSNLDEIPFDNSYLRRKRPEKFQLGAGYLLPGLDLGIRTMRKGEKAQFLIESDYAFGPRGCPPRIPPDATVLFEVELINFTDCAVPENLENIDNQDRQSFSYIYKKAVENYLLGNESARHKEEKAAIQKYKKAVDLLLGCRLKDEEEEAKQKKILIKLYGNLCICYLKIKCPEKVCIMAREALYVDEKTTKQNAKISYHWGYALMMLGEYNKAADHLRHALKLQPDSKEIKNAISMLEAKKKMYAEQEKIYFRKAFGFEPVKDKVTPVSKDKDAISKDLVEEIKRNIQEAKSGKEKKLTLLPDVICRVEDLCKSLITEEDKLSIERIDNRTILIKKIKE